MYNKVVTIFLIHGVYDLGEVGFDGWFFTRAPVIERIVPSGVDYKYIGEAYCHDPYVVIDECRFDPVID